MFLTERKLQSRIRDLARLRYRDSQTIEGWQLVEDPDGAVGTRPATTGPHGQKVRIGDRWEGRDRYAWLSVAIAIPEIWRERRVLARFDFGRTGAGNNSGFESLLYLDGEPYQGVDSNHQEVFLPADRIGQWVKIDLRLWSGLEGGGRKRTQEYRFAMAELTWLDEASDDLFFTAMAALQTVHWLDENSAERVQLLGALDRALDLLDWREPGSEAFYESVSQAQGYLDQFLDGIEKHSQVTAYCVGHTHIDVAWLWRLQHTREKAARSFSTVLRLMEQYPEYVFLQTQPQLYEYLKTDYPDIYSRLKERVAQGRWEAGGAMWLEADCNLPSGESLVRQLLLGTRLFEKEFGVTCKYLWLPDVFGYSWALPQILRKSGIHTFMTTKISWNQYNRMPHDTFLWRGLDGSEVLAHFITTPEPGSHKGWFYTYNGQLTAETVAGAWSGYRDKSINQELLVSYGFGDGGGGVTRDMLELRRRLDRMPGIPHVKTGRADEYFERLQATVESTDAYVHTWDGELYLEYHRGTYTSQAYNKRMNRKLELAYRETEWINAWVGKERGRAARLHLTEGWKILLRNQFHDIIPGSSIHEVYEDSRLEYADAAAIGVEQWTAAVQAMTSANSDHFVVFNSAGHARGGVVRLPLDVLRGKAIREIAGEHLRMQVVDDEYWIQVKEVPGLGYTALIGELSAPVTESNHPFTFVEGRLSTPYYDLAWNTSGQLTTVYDKRCDRQVLAEGARANVLQVFEDKPLAHDAWDIDLFYQRKMREITDLVSSEVLSVGPVAAIIRNKWVYGNSVVTQDLIVYADSPRIDFATSVDWQERQQLLKVAFPVAVRATEATFDIQFGNVKRPTHWNTSWDQARFETVGHQWADVSETGYGVALANDCKYGYDVKDNVLRLTLLKSATYPDPDADRGDHRFTYSLIPHSGNWLDGRVAQEAWDLNSPLRVETGVVSMEGQGRSMFDIQSDSVQVDAVKLAEDSDAIILRFHDFTGGRSRVQVEPRFFVQRWCECDLLERPEGTWSAAPIALEIKPFEIKTLLIERRTTNEEVF
ncbi:MAG: alpha-mannosidase [Firmicutes bacterium]|nr:alpha-mannosidase [Bacillota bacterium]